MLSLTKKTKYGPIGLDIGTSGVKLLQLADRDGQPALVAAAHAEISSDDEALREVQIAKFLDKSLRHGKFHGRDVVCSLGHREYQMKNLRLPQMPDEEMAAAMEFEARERFDTNGASAQFRHMVAGEVRHGTELKEELIVFAATDDVISRRLQLVESVNLRPKAIDLAPCAVARSFIRFLRRAEDVNSVNVFVDVGWRATSILITRGTELAFLKTIDTGGRALNQAAAGSLGISDKDAAELRIRIMRESAGNRGDEGAVVPQDLKTAVADALRPVAEQISKDLQLCMRYYAVTFRGHRPDSITLVGGEAHDPVLQQTIGTSTDIPCIVGYPLRGVQGASALPREERSFHPAWAVACGLALRNTRWVAPAQSAAVSA